MKFVIISAIVILTVFIFALTRIPIAIEPLTELYFEDHTKLPQNISLDKEYSFQFTIRNLENKDMAYPYSVTKEYSNKIGIIDNAEIFLKNDETKTVTEKFKITEPFDRAKIKVNLKNKNQDIHFWVEKENKK